jgi:hypothetical protein
MAWPNLGLPVTWNLVSRLPNVCLFNKTAFPQIVVLNCPALLTPGVFVDAMHATVLYVDVDILLDTTTFKAKTSVPT